MSNTLKKEFTFSQLFIFALPSIVMMVFMSLYSIVDGFFVSRFVSTDALSALNIIYPIQSILVGISVMFGTGGSAVVAKKMGEQDYVGANSAFSYITLFGAIVVGAVSILTLIFIEPIVTFLGATPALMPLSVDYLSIICYFGVASFLQLMFQIFFVTAGKPALGLILTVLGGICNVVLDYIFIVEIGMGLTGAAYATVIGYCIPAIGGLIFFVLNKKGLHLTKFKVDNRVIIDSSFNGSSEMVTNLATSVTTLLFNVIMMNLVGSNGVAAITVVLYCQFLMIALFLGFTIGIAPVISYHYGAENRLYLKKLVRMSLKFVFITSFAVFALAIISADFFAQLFAGDNLPVKELAAHGLRLFAFSFLFAGVNIYASALYTALSNGRASAVISFSRTFLFTVMGIILFSSLWGTTGLFLSTAFAEMISILLVIYIYRKTADTYGI